MISSRSKIFRATAPRPSIEAAACKQSRRQLVSHRALDLERLLHRRSFHHLVVVALQVGKRSRLRLERAEDAPVEAEQMDVGDGITPDRPFVLSQPDRKSTRLNSSHVSESR